MKICEISGEFQFHGTTSLPFFIYNNLHSSSGPWPEMPSAKLIRNCKLGENKNLYLYLFFTLMRKIDPEKM